MIAAAKPAIMIPMMISAVVEFNLAEKNTMIAKAEIAPKKEAIQISQELLTHSEKPSTADKNITNATPSPEAEVMPKTEGSANGFLNSSCKIKPLTGSAIPAKTAAMVLGNRKSKINCLAFSSEDQSESLMSELPRFRLIRKAAAISKISMMTVILNFNLYSLKQR